MLKKGAANKVSIIRLKIFSFDYTLPQNNEKSCVMIIIFEIKNKKATIFFVLITFCNIFAPVFIHKVRLD